MTDNEGPLGNRGVEDQNEGEVDPQVTYSGCRSLSLSKISSLKYLWDAEAVGVTIVLKPKEEDIDATKLFWREDGTEEVARHSGPDQPRIQK